MFCCNYSSPSRAPAPLCWEEARPGSPAPAWGCPETSCVRGRGPGSARPGGGRSWRSGGVARDAARRSGATRARGRRRTARGPGSARRWSGRHWPREPAGSWNFGLNFESGETYIIWSLLERSWRWARIGVRSLWVLVISVGPVWVRAGGHPRTVPRTCYNENCT